MYAEVVVIMIIAIMIVVDGANVEKINYNFSRTVRRQFPKLLVGVFVVFVVTFAVNSKKSSGLFCRASGSEHWPM